MVVNVEIQVYFVMYLRRSNRLDSRVHVDTYVRKMFGVPFHALKVTIVRRHSVRQVNHVIQEHFRTNYVEIVLNHVKYVLVESIALRGPGHQSHAHRERIAGLVSNGVNCTIHY